jgi:hypothetical protein
MPKPKMPKILAAVFFLDLSPLCGFLQKLAEEELDALKNSLRKFFTEGEGADSGVTSLYFVREGQRSEMNHCTNIITV